MSLAIALEELMPGALYRGSLTADTPEAYASIEWMDPRPKPPFEKVQAGTVSVIKDDLKAFASKLRYKRQRGGYTYRSNVYNADTNAITALTMAFTLAKANTSYNTSWKLANGKFLAMSSQNIVGVYTAITGFVQALFSAEAIVTQAIDAGSVTTKEQVLSAINTVPNSS
jgi:hypothetical protein